MESRLYKQEERDKESKEKDIDFVIGQYIDTRADKYKRPKGSSTFEEIIREHGNGD